MTITIDVATSNAATALPSGTVTLTEDGVSVGTGTLAQGAPSVATITLNIVSAGTHILAASYPGDSYYTASNSTTVSIVANKGATTTTVTASPATLTANKTETLTATVVPTNAVTGVTYTLTGTVKFYDGTTLLGSASVASNTATLSGISLKDNVSHSITAVYQGDSNWYGSTSNALPLDATTLPVYVVLTSNFTTAPPGAAVVLTATVTPTTAPGTTGESNPTGIVIFYSGTTAIGQATLVAATSSSTSYASVATLTTTTLPGGQDTIYAVYQGDDYYDAATSNNLTITVQDFTITASSTNPATDLTIVKGSSGSASYDITGEGGFNNQVQVVCAVSSQDDMTCTASPQQVTPPGTVTFVVQTFKTGTTASKMTPGPLWPRAIGGTALAAIGFLFLPYGRRVRRRLLARAGKAAERGLLMLLLLAGLLGTGVGCTSTSSVSTVSAGTPLGVATLKITATAYVNNAVVSHSLYLTVNVVTGN
jgi:predicted component of type VI protein secretion system